MNLYDNTAAALRAGTIAGITIIAVGLLLSAFDNEHTENVLWFGILVLIASPLFGLLISAVTLVTERDWKWVSASAVLLAVITAGIVAAYIM